MSGIKTQCFSMKYEKNRYYYTSAPTYGINNTVSNSNDQHNARRLIRIYGDDDGGVARCGSVNLPKKCKEKTNTNKMYYKNHYFNPKNWRKFHLSHDRSTSIYMI